MSDDQPVLGRSHPTAHLPIATARSTEQLDLVQRSSIVRFLSGTLAPEALADEIADEVAAFREALRTTASGNIIVSNGPQFLVTKTGARRLLEAVAREKLPFDAANYIADCIIMNLDFDFEDDFSGFGFRAALDFDAGFDVAQFIAPFALPDGGKRDVADRGHEFSA